MIYTNKKTFIALIILGVLIRLVVMATTYHPDLRAMEFAGLDIVDNGHYLSFYDTLRRLPAGDPLVKSLGPDELNYPPLAYTPWVIFRLIFHPLYNRQIDYQILTGVERIYGTLQLAGQLFMLKLPNLVADLCVAWSLTGFFTDSRKKCLAVLLWLYNPLTLYATFAIGQIDIWPTLFSVLAALAIGKNRPGVAAGLLGIGGAFKLFPLLFLVPLAALWGKTWRQKIILLGVGLGIYLAITAPFALISPGYRASALVTPQVEKMLFARINVSGDQYLSFFAVGFSLIVLGATYQWRRYMAVYWMAILLLFYAVTNYHPQWFLWITPWLLLLNIKDKQLLFPSVLLILCDIGITLSFDSSLHYGLLAPVFPLLASIPYTLPGLLSRFMPWAMIVSLLRSLLAGVSIFFLYHLIEGRSNAAI